MSEELKWCLTFNKIMHLRSRHRTKRIRKKNIKRSFKMMNQAFEKWGGFPLPDEWK